MAKIVSIFMVVMLSFLDASIIHAEAPLTSTLIVQAVARYCNKGVTADYLTIRRIVAPEASRLFNRRPSDRDDLIQRVFEKIWKRCAAITALEEGKVAKYIKVLTQNEGLDMLRKSGRDPLNDPVIADVETELQSPGMIPDEIIHQAHENAIVTSFVKTLPAETRAALAMIEADDMTIRAAAGVLDLPYTTLASRLSTARTNLDTILYSISDGDAIPVEIWKKTGMQPVPRPTNSQALADRPVPWVDIALANPLPKNVQREAQASGRYLWSKGPTVDLGDFVKTNAQKVSIVANGGDYYGWSMTMKVPKGVLPNDTTFFVRDAFALTPPSKTSAQRMVVAAARYRGTDMDGAAVYDLEAYCLDEHLDAPNEAMSYAFLGEAQNIVSPSVKAALRLPVDEAVKGGCVWKAVSGIATAPGVCQ